MENQPPPNKVRVVGRGILRVLLPFHAMRRTAHLAKQETQRARENVVLLRDLASQARQSVTGNLEESDEACNQEARQADISFAEAMAHRGPDAMSKPNLRRFFLAKKRMALTMAALFLLAASAQFVWGLTNRSPFALFLSVACFASSMPLCFVISLSATFRIWQLDTQRLSKSEKGGLDNFKQEIPRWWIKVLDPEFRRGNKGTA